MALVETLAEDTTTFQRFVQSDPADPGFSGERIEYKSGPQKNAADAKAQLATAVQAARDRVTAARASKNAATAAKGMTFTTVAEGRTAFRALCDVVNDVSQEIIDTNQAQLRMLRYLLGDFSTPPE